MVKMSVNASSCAACFSGFVVILVLSSLSLVRCQVNSASNPFGDFSSAALPFMTQIVNSQLSNLSRDLSQEIKSKSSFCVKDP